MLVLILLSADISAVAWVNSRRD